MNCTVVTIATKVTYYRCTNEKVSSFPHSGVQVLQQVFKMASPFIRTGLKSLMPFNRWRFRQCFVRSHFKCPSSTVSGQPCLELASDTHESATHDPDLVFNKTNIRANWS